MSRPDERGNSFALGQAASNGNSMGNSMANGPGAAEFAQGWHIRPLFTIWDGTEGRPPA